MVDSEGVLLIISANVIKERADCRQRLLFKPFSVCWWSPMYIFIYFITFRNKCLYNYSPPHAASTAHFDVNPLTKKKWALQKSLKARCWLWLCSLPSCSVAWITCTPHTFSSSIHLCFCLTKALRAWLTCAGEEAWNGSQLLWTGGWCLMCSIEQNVRRIWSGQQDPHISSFCIGYTHSHTHTHLSNLANSVLFFKLIIITI